MRLMLAVEYIKGIFFYTIIFDEVVLHAVLKLSLSRVWIG